MLSLLPQLNAPWLKSSGEEDCHGPIRWAGRSCGDMYGGGGGTIGPAPDVEGCRDERSSSRRSDPKYSGPSAPLLGGRYAERVAPRDSRARLAVGRPAVERRSF